MKNIFERGVKAEKEPTPPSIRLEFFRHDEKEKAASSGPGSTDETIRLTQKGRDHSVEMGQAKDARAEVGVAFGSPKERAMEAALRQLLSGEDEVQPEDSLEDIQAKSDKRLGFGKKGIVSENLNFNWGGTPEFKEAAYKHYLESKDALAFFFEQSDELAKNLKDKESTSYSRIAARMAELVKKYLGILPRWEEIAAKDPDKYSQYGNEMQRFMGSHQTALEPFLMKIVEKLEGREAVGRLIASFPDKNGFGFGEGFSVNIVRGENGDPVAKISCMGKEWIVTPGVIESIIHDRDVLDEEIERSVLGG
jgi:hypothetical protein